MSNTYDSEACKNYTKQTDRQLPYTYKNFWSDKHGHVPLVETLLYILYNQIFTLLNINRL